MSYNIPLKGLDDLSQSINRSKKYLIETYPILQNQKTNPDEYDGGVSILLAMLNQVHNVNIGFTISCNDLVSCAKAIYRGGNFKFNVTDEDIFGTPFLKQLYLTGDQINQTILDDLEKYLEKYQNFKLGGLVSFFNIYNQTYYKYINVGLALVAIQKNHTYLTKMTKYKNLYNKVVVGLWSVFKNEAQLEEQYLDPMKAMSIWLLFMLNEIKNTTPLDNYIKCLIREQATNGQWINSDLYDGNNLVNDLILTTISLMNLISYQQHINLEESPKLISIEKNSIKNDIINNDNNIDLTQFKKQEDGLTAFQSSDHPLNTTNDEIITSYESFNVDKPKKCNNKTAKNTLLFLLFVLMVLFVARITP